MSFERRAAILAGGEGRRMGAQKPLQLVRGVTMIERVVRAVSACVGRLVIVTNRPEPYAFLGIETIADRRPGLGPLAGIEAAFEHFGDGNLLVLACDYPFLEAAALERLLAEDPAGGVVLPEIEGRLHPLCALYGAGAARTIEDALDRGERTVLDVIARLPRTILGETEFGGPEAALIFWNVNTPEDLRQAEARLAQAQPRG